MSAPALLYRSPLLLLLILVGSILVGSAAPLGADGRAIASSFGAGTEGWSVWEQSADFRHDPRGFLSATEAGPEPAWWSAGPEFLGDRGAAYGGAIRVRLRDDRARGARLLAPGLLLGGAGMELVYRTRPIREPRGSWWSVQAELHDREGWYHAATGELATEGELRAVLGNLERLLIRSRIHRDARQADLDEVALSYGPGDEVTAHAPRQTAKYTVKPTKLDYKNVYLGDYAQRSLKITNTGTTIVTVRMPDVDPPFTLVSHSELGDYDVAPGASLEVTFEYRPDEAKVHKQINYLSFPFLKKFAKLELRGAGRHPVEVTPKVLQFGKVALGKEKTLSFKVRNLSVRPFTVLATLLPPKATHDWHLETDEFTLPGRGQFTLRATFRPRSTIKIEDELLLSFLRKGDDEPPSLVRSVIGQGKGGPPPAPVVEVEPTDLEFGQITTEQTALYGFEIRNMGNLPLKVTLPANLPAPFAWMKGGPAVGQPITLTPLDVLVPTVEYSPTAEGTHSGQFTIQTNDPQRPTVTIKLSGSAVKPVGFPQLEWEDADWHTTLFDNVPVGGFVERQIRFKNTGTADLEVYVDPVEPPFTTGPLEAQKLTVAPGATGTIFVQFAPTVWGGALINFRLYTNEVFEPDYLLQIQGYSPDPDAFGAQGGQKRAKPEKPAPGSAKPKPVVRRRRLR